MRTGHVAWMSGEAPPCVVVAPPAGLGAGDDEVVPADAQPADSWSAAAATPRPAR
jgi:hypothetical protein